ncbi:hypothetical protein [Nitrosomonas sp.]|uniref:hypothetical protein n=1 Tax=Nitrosomonas sp. TaxID=42353 RepID=UPI002600100E|nr:hypothetical protein [Nitrosomonas sp.]MBY0485438.1 hypothetical protein [Nitrosomonas sp.]
MSLKNSIKEFKAFLGDRESLLDKSYPRVTEMIQLHWGYKEFYLYISKLLIVEKEQNRQGFPLEVLQEIYKLQEIHESAFPNLRSLLKEPLNQEL